MIHYDSRKPVSGWVALGFAIIGNKQKSEAILAQLRSRGPRGPRRAIPAPEKARPRDRARTGNGSAV